MPENSSRDFEPFSQEEEEWIKEQRRRGNRRKGSSRGGGEDTDVNINSLMDILVVLLVFLLKSYGDQPIQVTGSDLRVPKSTAKLKPEDMTSVTVSRKYIVVNDEEVAEINKGEIDEALKKDGKKGLVIKPLLKKLSDVIERQKRQAKRFNETFDPVVTIIADQSTPYRLLTEVMVTASNAEVSKFKFATIQNKRANVM
jgi:biopolymer transport protein ExbD